MHGAFPFYGSEMRSIHKHKHLSLSLWVTQNKKEIQKTKCEFVQDLAAELKENHWGAPVFLPGGAALVAFHHHIYTRNIRCACTVKKAKKYWSK